MREPAHVSATAVFLKEKQSFKDIASASVGNSGDEGHAASGAEGRSGTDLLREVSQSELMPELVSEAGYARIISDAEVDTDHAKSGKPVAADRRRVELVSYTNILRNLETSRGADYLTIRSLARITYDLQCFLEVRFPPCVFNHCSTFIPRYIFIDFTAGNECTLS